MKKPESRLQAKIREALERELGGFWFKVHGGPFQRAGIPDLLGCVNGRYIALEVKTPEDKRGKVKLQEYTMGLIKEAGGFASTVYSPEAAVRKVKQWLGS